MARRTGSLTQGPLLKRILLYTIPIICTGVLQLLFNAADLVVVGNHDGSVSVGAVGATTALINLFVNFFIGLSAGTGVIVAQGIGAGDREQVLQTIHTAIPTAVIGGAILTIVGVCCSHAMLVWMDTPENVLPLSTRYMQIYFCGVIANLLYNYGAAILRAAGDTRSPLLYLSFAGVLNIGLNLVFVNVCNLGVAGVALATIVSQAVSAVLVLRALMRRDDDCRLELRSLGIHGRTLWKIIRLGLPAGIQGSLFSISNVMIQSSVNSFALDYVVSGNAASSSLEGFVYTSMNAFHQTALNFVGQCVGARDYRRVRETVRKTVACVAAAGFGAGMLVLAFGRQLLGIYITDSPEAIEIGLTRLTIFMTTYFLCGMMDVMTGALRGMGLALAPMGISIVGVCGLRLLWIFTIFQLPAFHSLGVLYLSYPLSWILTFTVEVLVYRVLISRREKAAYSIS